MAQEVMKSSPRAVRRYDSGEATRNRDVFRPRTDIYETGDGVVLLAEMPGVEPGAVDITLEQRVLTIRGRTPDFDHEGYRQIYSEYRDGDYERAFTLSEDIDRDHIKASQKDGVLTLFLPKAAPAKAKKIKVRAA